MEYKQFKFKQLNDKDWLTQQLKEKSMHLIAQEVGCSYSAVVWARNKFGIKINPSDGVPRRREYDASATAKAAHKKKYPDGRFGSLASNWRGGRRRSGTGGKYVMLYSPDHPKKDSDGYVMEHRLLMEKKIGRYLDRHEVVHHINGKKDDNRIENLELIVSKGDHTREHFERSFRTEQAEVEVERLKIENAELRARLGL